MSEQLKFEMRVVELFRFGDGRTVFAGPITSDAGIIGRCDCRLVVGGVERATIQIEGEMIPNGSHPEGHRSVSTRQQVPLERDTVRDVECFLESIYD
jgi:hypothetical protein